MSTIIYFSGTGNCFHVAKEISKHQNAKLISVTNYNENYIDDDMIGIVTPVYCGELPQIIKDFLERVIVHGKYIWSLAVCGGGVGTTFETLDKILRYNESRLHFGAVFLMPDNSIIIPQNPIQAGKMLENEPALIEEYEQMIDSKIINKYPVDVLAGKTSKLQWASLKGVLRIDNKKVNNKTCIDCRKCVTVCPTENIKVKDGKIVIGKNCVNCFACLHWCPTHSIRAGRIKVNEKKRYVHPDVTFKMFVKDR